MIKVTPAWLGASNYQFDVETDMPVDHAEIYAVSHSTMYYVGTVAIGQSVVELPADIPYGAMRFFAIARDASNVAQPTISPGHYSIYEGNRSDSPFWVSIERRSLEPEVAYTDKVSAYRMRIEITDSIGLPKKLFLYKLNRDWKYEVGDEFQGICRPGDFDKYPEEEPVPGEVFFRKSYVDVVAPNSQELEKLWDAIRADVQQLVWTLEANLTLGASETEIIRT